MKVHRSYVCYEVVLGEQKEVSKEKKEMPEPTGNFVNMPIIGTTGKYCLEFKGVPLKQARGYQ